MPKREVKIGVVGVDSGQLLICDPCYIEEEWEKSEDSGIVDMWHDTETGSYWHCLRGNERCYPTAIPFRSYDEELSMGETANQRIQSGKWKQARPRPNQGEFSYAGCCDATINEEDHGGQLMYKLGHEGAGVAFSSGLGDGCYDVYATIEDVPDLGERVTSVRIDLMG